MTKKEIAKKFLELVGSGQPRQAFALYVLDDFIHHNVYFKGDRQTLMMAMEEAHKEHPNKELEIQRVLEDGDLVAIHSRFRLTPTDNDRAVMHIFRFNGEHIVELWDFGQAVPEDMINENGMF